MNEKKNLEIFALNETLSEITEEEALRDNIPAVFLTNARGGRHALEITGMGYEGDLDVQGIGFSKVETQQECLYGTFCIPKLLDVLQSRYRIMFFVNHMNIVIIDDDGFSNRLIRRIKRKKIHQGDTKEKFLYNFVVEFMNRDLQILVDYEKRLRNMEEEVMDGKVKNFQREIVPIRNELLMLRGYYDEIADIGKELEENENEFFAKKQLKFFGTITDRAERLMGKTVHLLDYAQQVKDAYQTNIDTIQNSNMQFLTIISTIFFPLTLITGWYGMNFQNMPELKSGYPFVIILSLSVVLTCIIIFKKKHIL